MAVYAGKWEGERVSTLVFPTAEYADTLMDLAHSGSNSRLVLIVNPQWTLEGQVISDFGLGADGQRRSKFAESFVPVFYFKRLSVYGDRITLMRVYPGGWQVYWTPQQGKIRMIGIEYRRPGFSRLVELLQPHPESRTAMSWLERMRDVVPQSQAASWPGLQYDFDASPGLRRPSPGAETAPAAPTMQQHSNGFEMLIDGGAGGGSSLPAGKNAVASESTVFVHASGDLDVNNASRHWGAAWPSKSGAWAGPAPGEGLCGPADLSYSRHQSESGPLQDELRALPSVGGGGSGGAVVQGGRDASAERAALEDGRLAEQLAELTGESSESGRDAERRKDGGLAVAQARQAMTGGRVFDRLESPSAQWQDMAKVDLEAAESDLQRVARLRTRLLNVNTQLASLEQERGAVLAELTMLSGSTQSQILRDPELVNMVSGPMVGADLVAALEAHPPADADMAGADTTMNDDTMNDAIWHDDGGEQAKDMKNNVLDLFKGFLGGH